MGGYIVYGVLFALLLLMSGCTIASEKNDVLYVSLQGYCTSKSKNVLQDTSIPLPDVRKNKEINWRDVNAEALADAYFQNKLPAKLTVQCDQLILLSPKEIQLGFNNKPKHSYDFYLNEEWAGFFEKYPGVKAIVNISKPGYSKDRRYAVIYIVLQCGPLCGYADFFQYENVDGSWELDKIIFVSKS